MINRELPTPVNHFSEKQLFKEKILFPNGCILLLTSDCPSVIADQLREIVEASGVNWLLAAQCDKEIIHARRDVFLPNISDLDGNYPVFKRKEKYLPPKDEVLKVGYFTNSLVHEARTSEFLREILLSVQNSLPASLIYKGKEHAVLYQVQQPWGALIDSKNSYSRFSFFKRAAGTSIRDHVALAGGWNYIEQEEREFLAQVNRALNQLAREAVKLGLEPWDLGVHQIVYEVDPTSQTIKLTILDTEEYNLPLKFGSHWTQALLDIGLPPIILFL